MSFFSSFKVGDSIAGAQCLQKSQETLSNAPWVPKVAHKIQGHQLVEPIALKQPLSNSKQGRLSTVTQNQDPVLTLKEPQLTESSLGAKRHQQASNLKLELSTSIILLKR